MPTLVYSWVLRVSRLIARAAWLALPGMATVPAAAHAQSPQTVAAPSAGQFRLAYAPAAFHRSETGDHIPYNHLVAGEWLSPRWTVWNAQRSIVGLALFNNSFGQFSQYAFVGQEWDLGPLGPGTVLVNATAGLLHGYRGEHRDKIPFNHYGTAPVIIPSAGWRYQHVAIMLTVLGTNGVMLGASWTFPPF